MKKSPFTVLSSKIIAQARHLSLEEQQVTRPDGEQTDYYTVRHPGAVVIIPVTASGSLLILEQYRHALGEWILEFPAGTLDPNESPQTCAARELIEETGFSATQWTPLGKIYPAPGFCDEVQHGYLAQNLTPAAGELDDDEFLEVVEITQSDLQQKVISGEITDAKTLAFFAKAKALNLL